MNSTGDFAKMVPGFDFLQSLMKNAGSALPSMSQWIAPTLDPAELEKRIEELRTVQFWLEQNARMLAATIQALEVQRMTLSTLKTMNLPVADMAEAFKIRSPGGAAEPAPRAAAKSPAAAQKAAPKPKAAESAAAPAPGVVDPMQWWGALTRQFTELAAKTLNETAGDAARNLDAMVKSTMDAAAPAVKPAQAPAKARAGAKPADASAAPAAARRRARPR